MVRTGLRRLPLGELDALCRNLSRLSILQLFVLICNKLLLGLLELRVVLIICRMYKSVPAPDNRCKAVRTSAHNVGDPVRIFEEILAHPLLEELRIGGNVRLQAIDELNEALACSVTALTLFVAPSAVVASQWGPRRVSRAWRCL